MSVLKTIINNVLFTVSTFTTIPTPKVEYSSENTKFTYFILPFVGLIVGSLTYFILLLFSNVINEAFILAIISLVINILVTGGIHYDGLLDSLDAFKSYRSREEKLRIIKDSRVGAFALIYFVVVISLHFISSYYIISNNYFKVVLIAPIISRTLLLLLIRINSLEKDDMLEAMWSSSFKKYYIVFLVCYLTFAITLYFNIITMIVIIVSACYMLYYNKYFKNHFDNLSGDLCGYFIVCCEGVIFVSSALYIILK